LWGKFFLQATAPKPANPKSSFLSSLSLQNLIGIFFALEPVGWKLRFILCGAMAILTGVLHNNIRKSHAARQTAAEQNRV
jgi:hypothetical protein